MSLQDRIESLKAKHASLESAIAVETQRPSPDNAHIADLKRQKLRIKDEIIRIGPTH
ncbi:MAG: YdcH family protein [Magnetospirillum sp.]|nr:YdcH family protein [Magnetospirillum sp.]